MEFSSAWILKWYWKYLHKFICTHWELILHPNKQSKNDKRPYRDKMYIYVHYEINCKLWSRNNVYGTNMILPCMCVTLNLYSLILLRPSNAIWPHGSLSTLVQVFACRHLSIISTNADLSPDIFSKNSKLKHFFSRINRLKCQLRNIDHFS